MNNNRRWRPESYISFIFSFFQTIFFPYSALVFFCVCVCACTWYKYDVIQKGEKRRKIGVKSAVSTHFQSRPMSKNNPHHCFSALIPVFVWKCSVSFFVFFSSGTLLSSSGGIISSVDVPGGIQREVGGRGNSLSLSHSSRLEDVSRSPFDALQNEDNIALLSSNEISKKTIEGIKTFVKWMQSTSLTNVYTVVTSVSVLKLFMLPSVIRCPSPPTLICQVKA